MTIGIGVLSSSKPKPQLPRPDSIILMADTMGSSDFDSTDELRKMWIDDKLGVYATAAGTMEYGGELFSIIQDELAKLDLEDAATGPRHRTHGKFSGMLNHAFLLLKAQHFQWDIAWSKLGLPILGTKSLEEATHVQEEWRLFWVDLHMIVGTFDYTGQAHLYTVGQYDDGTGAPASKIVTLREFPGFATIGSGGPNADFWLKFRGQSLSMTVRQSAYHAYEAKRMAAKSPTVNDSVDIAVIEAGGKAAHLTIERQEVKGCAVSLPELEALYKQFGPQKTDGLGFPKKSASQRSKRAR